MTDYYFDSTAPSGGDGSQANPYNSVSQLSSRFIGGNRILFHAGKPIPVSGFSTRLRIAKTGDGTLNIGAYGAGDSKPYLTAAAPSTAFHLLDVYSTSGTVGPSGRHVIIEDIAARNSDYSGGLIRASANAIVEDVLVRRCDFSNNGQSTAAKGADGLTVDTSKITVAGQQSITRRIRIEDSTFDDNGCHGTKARGNSRYVQWIRCKARRNGYRSPAHAFGGTAWTIRPIAPGITGYSNQYSYVTAPWTSHTGNIFFTEWGSTDNQGVSWAYPGMMDFKLCNINYLCQNRVTNNVMLGRMRRRDPGSQNDLAAYEWCVDGVNPNRVYCNFGTANVGTGLSPAAGTFLPSLELTYDYATDLYWEDCLAEDQYDYDGFEGSAFHMDDDSGFATAVRITSRRCHYGLVVNGGEAFKVYGARLYDCKKSPISVWCGSGSRFHNIVGTGIYSDAALVQGNGTGLDERVEIANSILQVGSAYGIRQIDSANYLRSSISERGNVFIGEQPPSTAYSNATVSTSRQTQMKWRTLPSGIRVPGY